MPCASGDCVLTTVEGIQNLISYLHITSCPYQNVSQPFELKGVGCNRIDYLNTNLPSSTNLSMQNVFSERLVNESELESDSNKRECIESIQTQSKVPHEVESMLARACDLKRVKRNNEKNFESKDGLPSTLSSESIPDLLIGIWADCHGKQDMRIPRLV